MPRRFEYINATFYVGHGLQLNMEDHSLCQALLAYPASQFYPDKPSYTLMKTYSHSTGVSILGWHQSSYSLDECPKGDLIKGVRTLQPLEVPETVSMRELLLCDEKPQMDVRYTHAGLDVGLD